MSSQIPAPLQKFIPATVGAGVGLVIASVISLRGQVGFGVWSLVPILALFVGAGWWIMDRIPDQAQQEEPEVVGKVDADNATDQSQEVAIDMPVETAVSPTTQLAEIGDRLKAKIADGLFISVVSFFAAAFIGWDRVNTFELWNGDDMLAALVALALFAAVNISLFAKTGQTVGKWFFGIKVVRLNGSPCDVGRWIFLRVGIMNLVTAIPFVGWIIHTVGLFLVFRDSRQCLHDQIADTIVVKVA